MHKRIPILRSTLISRFPVVSIFFGGDLLTKWAVPALMLVFAGCEERYWPDLGNKYENLLVVEGMITSDPGPYTVRLSRSTSVENPEYIPVTDYQVIIRDDQGEQEILSETEPGVYRTHPDGMQGIVSRHYQLYLESPQGVTYQSAYEELKEPVEMDSVFVGLEYHELSGFDDDIPGYQFFVNTNPSSRDSNYYMWNMERTYEYHSDFLIYFWYDGTLHVFPDSDSLQVCWKTDPIHQIFTASTDNLTEPVLINFPLHFVYFNNREFSVLYSLHIQQLTLTKEAFDYWTNVNSQNTAGGEYYSKMPYQLRGNVSNTGDPDEPVLGYFQAAGTDEKRLFFERPGYPAEMSYSECVLTIADYEEYGWMFRIHDPREFPIYVTMNANGARAVPNQACVDCLRNGGTIVKPDFWPDK